MTKIAMIQLKTEPPPAREFPQLENEYQEMIAKEKQLTMTHWLSDIGLRPFDGGIKGCWKVLSKPKGLHIDVNLEGKKKVDVCIRPRTTEI